MRKLLIDVTPLIKALELTSKTILGGELIGSYKSRFKGRGIEFQDYMEYISGDDASLIDWKASVRSNKILVREYTEERSIRIFFLIDVSNSMIYTTGRKLKSEFVGELITSLAFIMVKSADQIGFALFNDKIVTKAPILGGLVQYYKLIDTLINAENYGGGYDLNQALNFAFSYVRPKSMIIIISDFIGLKSLDWQESIRANAKRFDILTFMIRDPADTTLPKSKRGIVLKDPFSNKKVRIYGERVRQRYEAYVKQQEKKIEEFFVNAGADFLRLDTSKSFVEPVIKFFRGRKEKWK